MLLGIIWQNSTHARICIELLKIEYNIRVTTLNPKSCLYFFPSQKKLKNFHPIFLYSVMKGKFKVGLICSYNDLISLSQHDETIRLQQDVTAWLFNYIDRYRYRLFRHSLKKLFVRMLKTKNYPQ